MCNHTNNNIMDGYTNVCEATSQSHDLNSYRPTHRKGKKLLAEKKRRARINNCLMQIRDIVCHEEESKDSDIDKMEKAEILEKTLEVLTKLRNDYDGTRSSGSSHKAMAVRYASGFSSCAEESIRYIECSRLIPSEVKNQLQAHLRSIARKMESSLTNPSSTYDLIYPSSLTNMPTSVTTLPGNQPMELNTISSSLPKNASSSPLSSPSKRLDFQDPSQNLSTPIMTGFKFASTDRKVNIPSPILTSTPVLNVEDHEMVAIPVLPHGYNQISSQSNFSPITAHEFAQEHKENHPNDNFHYSVPTSYSQERKMFSSQGNSAFQKFTPHNLPSSSSSPTDQQSLHPQYISSYSSSTSSSLPIISSVTSVPLPSQYSPISPASSPVPTVCSMPVALPHSQAISSHQPIYQYHGYEPYTVLQVVSSVPASCATVLSDTPTRSSSLNLSHLTHSVSSSSSALDLCIKRESHQISPETMWRPW